MMVFPYDANGNAKPKRVLDVPHQAWGLSISRERNEVAVSVEAPREIVFYRRGAQGGEPPLRTIQGARTGLGDPHGIFLDGRNNEIIVANHGNQGGRQPASGDAARQPPSTGSGRPELVEGRGPRVPAPQPIVGGRFDAPSITVYAADGDGDIPPTRKIQGPKTGLNWPMAIDVDLSRNEIAVAND